MLPKHTLFFHSFIWIISYGADIEYKSSSAW